MVIDARHAGGSVDFGLGAIVESAMKIHGWMFQGLAAADAAKAGQGEVHLDRAAFERSPSSPAFQHRMTASAATGASAAGASAAGQHRGRAGIFGERASTALQQHQRWQEDDDAASVSSRYSSASVSSRYSSSVGPSSPLPGARRAAKGRCEECGCATSPTRGGTSAVDGSSSSSSSSSSRVSNSRSQCSACEASSPPRTTSKRAAVRQKNKVLRICGPTSPCVRETFAAHGYVRGDGPGWTVAWGTTLPFPEIARMEHGQKHNHMPGWNRLNHKGVLGEMAESLRSKGCGLALNVPKTWVLPQHASLLTKDAQSGGGPYILKPVGGTRGKGIRLAKRMSAEDVAQIRGKWVCQRYVKDVHLIKGRKYDLRLYVTATSSDPLRLYVHSEGYARLCSEAYDPTLARPNELFRHVTNSGFQKNGGGYSLHSGSTPDCPRGNKWHIDAVRAEWRRHGVDDVALWERICESITRVFLMFDSLGHDETRRFVRHRGGCFCLFGADILIDDKMQPWVLELNGVPSTGTDSPLDIRIKSSMMNDLMSLLDLSCGDPDRALTEVQASLMREKGFDMQRNRQAFAQSQLLAADRGGGQIPTHEQVRRGLSERGCEATKSEIELVIELEREMARRRGWRITFPSAGMGRYFPLLQRHRRSNEVMMKWLTRSSKQ